MSWESLRCPDDGAGPLRDVGEEALECPQCARRFEAAGGIANLLPRRLAEAMEGDGGGATDVSQVEEIKARDDESDIYDDLYDDEEYRYEIDSCLELLEPKPTDHVLDLGSGTGRVTKEWARSCASVTCADFSRQSLERLRSRPEMDGVPLTVVQAEGSALPFADASFDRATSFGVLCFVPSEELRSRFVAELRRVLRPGGTLVITTYHHAFLKKLWAAFGRTDGALKEGTHTDGRIWYRNDTQDEFVGTLSEHFDVRHLRGTCHRVPFISNRSRALAGRLDRLLGRFPALTPILATELMAHCVAPEVPSES